MLKRQDTLLSISSRRETPPPPPPDHSNRHAKSIGCMSHIFHLLSKYQHRRRRKFLTFGKKQEKIAQFPPANAKPSVDSSSVKRECPNKQEEKEETRDVDQRYSCDVVPRSPTIPPDFRRFKSVEDVRSPPALVARLMGLQEEVPAGRFPNMECSSSSEKRRKLMSDLEKCDKDLKELKKIIEGVRFATHPRSPPALKRLNTVCRGEMVKNSEQPSPVSVLDELTRSPLISGAYSSRRQINHGRISVPQQQKPAPPRKKPGEDDVFDSWFLNKLAFDQSFQSKREVARGSSSPFWGSKAMVESVGEVCKDIAWGEKREIGRIGLTIQDHICRDLIEEFVEDQLRWCYANTSVYSLPLQACKRRLYF